MSNPSTIWAQLSIPNPAAGSIPFVASDNETIVTDVLNFNYDATTQTLTVTNLAVTNLIQYIASGLTAVPYTPQGVISKQLVPAATGANTTETVLQTYTLPANVLNANGKGIKVRAWGTFAANANNKTIKAYWGAANVLIDSGALPANNHSWEIEFTIHRTNSNAQIAIGSFNYGTAFSMIAPANQVQGQTDTSNILINITGQNGTISANDIVCNGMTVEFIS